MISGSVGKLGWACPLTVCLIVGWVLPAGVHHVVGGPSPCPARGGSAAGCIDTQPDNVLGGAQISGFIETGWGSNQSFTPPLTKEGKENKRKENPADLNTS